MLQALGNNRKRARSDEEKALRRSHILHAAESIFADVGYESFSMAKLSKEAGVVKGTLYLYFDTREEVFLVMYNRSLKRWGEAFVSSLGASMSDLEYAELFYTTYTNDKGYSSLADRLEQSIKHNVSLKSFVKSKRLFWERVGQIIKASAPVLGLTMTQSAEVFRALSVLMVGAMRADQAPAFEDETIPTDVQAVLALFSSKDFFMNNASRLIVAIRSDKSEFRAGELRPTQVLGSAPDAFA